MRPVLLRQVPITSARHPPRSVCQERHVLKRLWHNRWWRPLMPFEAFTLCYGNPVLYLLGCKFLQGDYSQIVARTLLQKPQEMRSTWLEHIISRDNCIVCQNATCLESPEVSVKSGASLVHENQVDLVAFCDLAEIRNRLFAVTHI